MELTEAQQLLLKNKVKDILGFRTCSVCGKTDYNISLVRVDEYDTTRVVGGAIHPTVVVTCKGCGVNQLFNAIAMGVMDADTGGFKT